MIWILVLAAVSLIGLGLWGGPSPKAPPEKAAPENVSPDNAWEVLAKPIDRRELYIPDGRPDRRFLNGLMVGLGSGLLVASVALTIAPRGGSAQPAAPQAPVAEAPKTPAATQPPATTPSQPPAAAPPAATTPPPAATTPPPAPPKPANVTFVVEVGDMGPTIARNLKAAGLIADEWAFLERVSQREVDKFLKAGTFIIPTGATLDEVIDTLTA